MSKKYLFFDIESIDRKSRFTCTFGYVLVDEKFNIIESEDILINPDVIEYDWYVLKNMFYYTKEDALASPTFAHFFDKIDALICNPEIVVMGYAIANDLDFLRNDYERLGKSSDKLCGYDIQLFYKELNGLANGAKLFYLAKSFGLDVGKYTEHKSSDDAYVSMLIAKHYCETLNLSLDDLCSKYNIFVYPPKKKIRNPHIASK